MKFDRDELEKLVRKKVQEVNTEAGYRQYLEVPEMMEIVAQSIEEMLFDDENKLLAKYEEDWKSIFRIKNSQLEVYEKIIQDTLKILPVRYSSSHTAEMIPDMVRAWVDQAENAEEELSELRDRYAEMLGTLMEDKHE